MNKVIEFLKNLGGKQKSERKARRYDRGYLRLQRERVIRERTVIACKYGIPLSEAGMFAKSAPRRCLKDKSSRLGVHKTGLISLN